MSSTPPTSPPRLPPDLDQILRATSRSVYLTLRVVPRAMRQQLMLAYLFCRAADTIADTAVLPPARRVEFLRLFRSRFETGGEDADLSPLVELASGASGEGFSPGERALLESLDACFEIHDTFGEDDREIFRQLLTTLTRGMALDLEIFPSEAEARDSGKIAWLDTDADLDRYCYFVAGCVGEFWTDLQLLHVPVLASRDRAEFLQDGIRFGKGLQMTNVLRDLPGDLRIGRCYLPRERLEALGIEPAELREGLVGSQDPSRLDDLTRRLRPLYDDLLDLTLEHFQAGWDYTLRLPRRSPRLRLACAWPLLIGLETLTLLRQGVRELLAGERLKIPRSRVYQLMFASLWRIASNDALDHLYQSLAREARRRAPRP